MAKLVLEDLKLDIRELKRADKNNKVDINKLEGDVARIEKTQKVITDNLIYRIASLEAESKQNAINWNSRIGELEEWTSLNQEKAAPPANNGMPAWFKDEVGFKFINLNNAECVWLGENDFAYKLPDGTWKTEGDSPCDQYFWNNIKPYPADPTFK